MKHATAFTFEELESTCELAVAMPIDLFPPGDPDMVESNSSNNRADQPLVFSFSDGFHDRMQLGNKGANLVTMTETGFPVPQGFVVTISAFKSHMANGSLPESEIDDHVAKLEKLTGKTFGADLLVSVRSSGPVSMPGMMDTDLNISDRGKMLRSIHNIFESWNGARAREYRRLNKIPEDLGTAAIVQAMVFGNADERSGTGVLFTRNPNTGEDELFGEYLASAQGEDIVSGSRTPVSLDELRKLQPEIYRQLFDEVKRLERHFKDMQDIEFTIESGKLYILQTRGGKRTGLSAVRIAVDMAEEGLLTRQEALMRVTAHEIESTLHSRIEDPDSLTPILQGLPAAPGAVSGRVIFEPELAVVEAKSGPVVLVRPETAPDDIHGIAVASGVLTARGGYSSHAAIVTRAMGKPCITGAEGVEVDVENAVMRIGELEVKAGDTITIDGASGLAYLGEAPMIDGTASEFTERLLEWADSKRKIGVWANADTPRAIESAKMFGAEGIGLLRTERQFNTPESLAAIREFAIAESDDEERHALETLFEIQRKDFVEIFRLLNGIPAIVRLMDLPLHEFLSEQYAQSSERASSKREELAEVNPMMGHRGVRLGITRPGLYKMQVAAIQAALKEVPADVRVMVPQVISPSELLEVKQSIDHEGIKVGVMVETARACVVAKDLAKHAAFFSFGTNDLTQAVLSFSREDAEQKFLGEYLEKGILPHNPFVSLDRDGVVPMMQMAVAGARELDPEFSIGVCGEHGGDPESVKIAHSIGVTYVSCSPFRIPGARLAAAQAALEQRS